MTTFDYRRTHKCHELSKTNIGQTVTLSGWVNRRRDHGGLIFIDLRDRFGITQLVFDPAVNVEVHAMAEKLRPEWVISVKGSVIPRAEGMANPKMATGEIEIQVKELEILSQAKTPPFSICDEHIDVNEELRLKYRYLDMRRGAVTQRMIMRHKAMQVVRRYMDSQEFLEINTPMFTRSTPEGARDFLIPSRVHHGQFYALPQSPQILKQILMVGGMDRYFQIAPCFRDEDSRADRQPEFYQIDMEMSFVTREELFSVAEGLLKDLFKECLNVDVPTPFPRYTHAECLENYGSDKPDMRFDMKFVRLDDIARRSTFSILQQQLEMGGVIKAFCVKGGSDISRKKIDEYTQFIGRFGVEGLAWMKLQEDGLASNIVKFFSPELQQELIAKMGMQVGDLIFIAAGAVDRVNQGMDHLRRLIAKERNLIPEGVYKFMWVIDFPLFSWNADEKRLESEHHPFTSPFPEDIHLLDTEPLKARSSSYDIVLNGYELASGSQRIHSGEVQEKIFKILQLSEEEIKGKFGFFIEALSYGTPPHIGVALGFERLMMILTGTENMRDVMAFPKTNKGLDLMMEAPSEVALQQLAELHIKVVN
ncbi:MAG: aspS [Chlamydiales bacterium]|jgi:aspartyl-tRNA synthetase|nr:aspS [Chlamydiales bacterium]